MNVLSSDLFCDILAVKGWDMHDWIYVYYSLTNLNLKASAKMHEVRKKYTVLFKNLDFFVFETISSAHQSSFYLIKNTVKMWNIITI